MLTTGLSATKTITVTEENTALTVGSGSLRVFATPAMIALMEAVSTECIQAELGDGMTSVGTRLDVAHTAATPVGLKVTCESTLVEIDGRRLVFSVKAFDAAGVIGEGTHERFLVNAEKFMTKTESKAGL